MPARVAVLAMLCTVLAGSTQSVSPATAPLATYRLGTGWATFGLALPQGAAPAGVQLGSLPTQTDVKTTWPDGSIRFAVVTAQARAAGTYPLTPAARQKGSFAPTWPTASVRLVVGGQPFVAELPQFGRDGWLDGPLVMERREIVAPTGGSGAHPFLRVVFDVRSYTGGGHRLDVAVENVLDVPIADRVTYDVRITLSGKVVFEKTGITHPYLTRWRQVFTSGLLEAKVVPDFAPFIAARALPSYLSTVGGPSRPMSGTRYDILQIGDLRDPMSDHGGRAELAPYPDWTAQYLVHRRADQRAYVLKHGDLAGTYSIHLKEPDGARMISIDEHPNFWLDSRADADGRPKNGLRGMGYKADIAHQPSLAYVPYLVTGDRYYLDEMKFWANFCLIATAQDRFYNARGGSQGLLKDNEVRGIGWAVRNLGDAAAYLPDADPYRAYFRQKLQNNLNWLENYAATFQTPLGTLFTGRRPEDDEKPPYIWIALWEHTYVAWAIDHVLQHGFGPGAALRDRVAGFQLKLFTSEAQGYPRAYAAPYILAVGTRRGGSLRYFSTLGDVFYATYKTAAQPLAPFAGSYGPEARLMLMIAERLQLPDAREALADLMSRVGPDGASVAADLNKRSGWAVSRPSGGSASARMTRTAAAKQLPTSAEVARAPDAAARGLRRTVPAETGR